MNQWYIPFYIAFPFTFSLGPFPLDLFPWTFSLLYQANPTPIPR
jgi:hypothetical protein